MRHRDDIRQLSVHFIRQHGVQRMLFVRGRVDLQDGNMHCHGQHGMHRLHGLLSEQLRQHCVHGDIKYSVLGMHGRLRRGNLPNHGLHQRNQPGLLGVSCQLLLHGRHCHVGM